MNLDRDEREERHLQMLREHLIANCRDHIVEYQQQRDEAAARGNDHERKMYEGWLSDSRATLAWAEARQRAA